MEGSFKDTVHSINPTQIFDLASWRGHTTSTSQSVAPEQVRSNLGFQLSIPLERLYNAPVLLALVNRTLSPETSRRR